MSDIDDTQNLEVVFVSESVVLCKGHGDTAHPAVYLHIKNMNVKCPYCATKYCLRCESDSLLRH